MGCIPAQGVYLSGGYLPGVSTCLGVYLPGVPAQVLPPVNRMTDRCKNITLPQTSFVGSKNVRVDDWTAERAIIATNGTVALTGKCCHTEIGLVICVISVILQLG